MDDSSANAAYTGQYRKISVLYSHATSGIQTQDPSVRAVRDIFPIFKLANQFLGQIFSQLLISGEFWWDNVEMQPRDKLYQHPFGCEVHTTVMINILVLWVMTPC
jgi:hypothetical protein